MSEKKTRCVECGERSGHFSTCSKFSYADFANVESAYNDLMNQVFDIKSEIYALQQRVELLEKRQGIERDCLLVNGKPYRVTK